MPLMPLSLLLQVRLLRQDTEDDDDCDDDDNYNAC